jgi:hypothetical protein
MDNISSNETIIKFDAINNTSSPILRRSRRTKIIYNYGQTPKLFREKQMEIERYSNLSPVAKTSNETTTTPNKKKQRKQTRHQQQQQQSINFFLLIKSCKYLKQ